jgi:L-asparagine transporter-like permease
MYQSDDDDVVVVGVLFWTVMLNYSQTDKIFNWIRSFCINQLFSQWMLIHQLN